MRNNMNINQKGSTDVKPRSMPSGEKLFDAKSADVIRDESKWDAFQLVGDTNREEMEHEAKLDHEMSDAESKRVARRIVNFRLGHLAKMIMDAEAA